MPGKIREKIEIIENFHCIYRIFFPRIESFGEQINKGFIRISLIYDFSPAKTFSFISFINLGTSTEDFRKMNQKSYKRFFLAVYIF